MKILGEMHRQLLLVGAELVAAGAVAAAGDVFFLDFDELRVGLRGAGLQRHRRRAAAACTTSNCDAATSRGCCSPTGPTSRPP